jgi:hypothetical protein
MSFLTAWMLTLFFYGFASAQENLLVVRLAKLQIDAAQLESYKAAIREEIETKEMVKSLELVDTIPIILGAKAK